MHRKIWGWVRSLITSLMKQSFKTHSSFWVSDLEASLRFYRKLGFREVMSTRGAEVILLRNHRGDELNLMPRSPDSKALAPRSPASMTLRVDDLQRDLAQLQSWYPDLKMTEDAVSRQVRLVDPDSNVVELLEVIEPRRRSKKSIYHIATQTELATGLDGHYYVPPNGEYRFVSCRARSTFVAFSCKKVAEESGSMPLVIEMDQNKLRIEEEWLDSEIDSRRSLQPTTYPHVYTPIPRHAIIAVGKCEEIDGDFAWPDQFMPLSSIETSTSV
jgi:catechol 2,3-dioxygenase-like lactoylglutathione lyase family enzyme/uncharacterized protein (DUF952 family)